MSGQVVDADDRVGELDLAGAIAAKLAYNLTRPDHKPEARQAAGGKAY